MKKILIILCLSLAFVLPAQAFLYEVKIMSQMEIKQLSDDALIELFTDALIERQASETFHGRAGFSPKEYKSYKKLLGLIINLRQEMMGRSIDPPPISEWLR